MGRVYADLTGTRYGRLVVVGLAEQQKKRNKRVWKCICDCGNTHEAATDILNNGGVRSCGCLHKETTRRLGKRERTNKKEYGYSALNKLFGMYKRHAREAGRVFELDLETFKILTQQNCSYCNRVPETVMSSPTYNGEYIYNGIDRVDNTQGYVLENCVTCCAKCNRSKRDDEQIEHIRWVLQSADYIRATGLDKLVKELS